MQQYPSLAPGSIVRYAQFDGSGDAMFLAQLAQQAKPIAIITANALAAQRLQEEIPFFAPELRTHLLSSRLSGYRTRRMAVDYSVPLITDIKCAKLLVEVTSNFFFRL